MDIRWTYSETGGQLFPFVVERIQWGRHWVEVCTGSWCRFDEQTTNYPHRHEGFYECWLVTAGTGVYQHGDERYPLQAGVLNVADPGITHEIISHTGDLVLVYWTIRLESGPGQDERFEERIVSQFAKGHRHHCIQQQHLLSHFMLLSESAGPIPQWRQRQFLQLVVMETMAATSIINPGEPTLIDPDNMAQRALVFILENVTRPISVGDVADSVNMSERQLRRLF